MIIKDMMPDLKLVFVFKEPNISMEDVLKYLLVELILITMELLVLVIQDIVK